MYPLKQNTAITVPFFAHNVDGDAVTGKVTGDWTKRISKASGAFATMTATVTEKEGGWYDLVMDTGHSDALGLLTVYLTATGVKQVNLQFRVFVAITGELDATTLTAVATSVLDEAISEPSAIWTWPGSIRKIIGWLGVLSRNKLTQTATAQLARNDADSATVATSTHSDDGTTFIRGEFT